MKLIWLSTLALGLAACSAPAEKATPASKGSKATATSRTDRQAMSGRASATRKDRALAAAKIAGVAPTTLAKAVETALLKLPGGVALAADVEIERGKAVIEVKIACNGKIYEVEIDATTGAVQEVEDDDDDDDDDDDGDDDDGDDD